MGTEHQTHPPTCHPRRLLTSYAFPAVCRCSMPLPQALPGLFRWSCLSRGLGHCALSLPTMERKGMKGKSR